MKSYVDIIFFIRVKQTGACTITMTSHGHNGISNHWQLHCLFNSLFRVTSKKTTKLTVIWHQWHHYAINESTHWANRFGCGLICILLKSTFGIDIWSISCEITQINLWGPYWCQGWSRQWFNAIRQQVIVWANAVKYDYAIWHHCRPVSWHIKAYTKQLTFCRWHSNCIFMKEIKNNAWVNVNNDFWIRSEAICHDSAKNNYRSLISPLSLRTVFSDLVLWHHHGWSVTSRECWVLALWRHIHRLFLHVQIGAKAIFTSE